MEGDVCGGKNSDLKIVAPRIIICSVVHHNWLRQGCSTDVYVIINGDLTGCHYRDEIVEAFFAPLFSYVGKDFLLLDGNARLYQAWVVNEYIEGEKNIMFELA